MKILKRKISLEPYTSRVNFRFDAYNPYMYVNPMESDEKSLQQIQVFDSKSLDTEYNSYGLIPLDTLSLKTDGKQIKMSFSTIMSIYYWMKMYVALLNNKDDCNQKKISYDSALDFYNSVNKNLLSKPIEYYKNLDEKYVEYSKYIGDKDSFEDNVQGKSTTIGNEKKIKSIIVNYDKIDASDTEYRKCQEYDYPNCINMPILIIRTIDDMGEFTSFYNEWEEGVEYTENDTVFYNYRIYKKNHQSSDFDNGYLYSNKYKESYFAYPEVLTYDDRHWLEKSCESNSIKHYTDKDCDDIFKIKQWTDISKKYFTDKTGKDDETADNYDFMINQKTKEQLPYSIKNNKIIFQPTHEKLKETYNIVQNYSVNDNEDLGFFVIDDTLKRVEKHRYIIYNNKYFLVTTLSRNKVLTSYCIVDNIKYLSNYDINTKKEYFIINHQIIYIEEASNFIIHSNNIFKVVNDAIYMNNNKSRRKFFKIDSYTNIDNEIFFIRNNTIVKEKLIVQGENNVAYTWVANQVLGAQINKEHPIEELTRYDMGYQIDKLKKVIYVYKPFTIYCENGRLSGVTDSKLTSLYSAPIVVDNNGTEFLCTYNTNNKGEILPIQHEEVLNFICKVGTVSNISAMDEPNLFWGNIITQIEIYYSRNDIQTYRLFNDNNRQDNIAQAIEDIKEIAQDNGDKTIFCNITYYVGALITYDDIKKEYKYKCNGVKYVDQTTLSYQTKNYYITNIDFIFIHFYELNYHQKSVTLNEYSNTVVYVNPSYYSIEITTDENNKYRDITDDTISSPIFREEYKFGSSSLENVDGNIYIERGTSSAFEKHLKLLDVESLEDLETYGNGYYNIIKLN